MEGITEILEVFAMAWDENILIYYFITTKR